MQARPYRSLTISEDDQWDKVCSTILDDRRVAATIIDHGADPGEFWDEHHGDYVTLGQLRDWLGY
jgi:hypothetical protein